MDPNALLKTRLIGQIFQQHYSWLCARLSYRTGCSHSAEDIATTVAAAREIFKMLPKQ